MIRSLLTAALLALPGIASADAFEDAVDAWLKLDDQSALPALSALAKAENEDAMLLLGVVEQTYPRVGWLAAQDRATQKDIMRAPGGLSGTSWLKKVTGKADVAAAVMLSGTEDDFAARAVTLLKAGEWAGAINPLMTAFNQDPGALVGIAEAAPLPETMTYLLWFSAAFPSTPAFFTPGGARDPTAAERALLDQPLSPDWAGSFQSRLYLSLLPEDGASPDQLVNLAVRQGAAFVAGNPVFAGQSADVQAKALDDAASILMTAKELAPLRALCETSCGEVKLCTATLYSEIGGINGLINLHTPLATLIAQERYTASARFLDDLRRLARPPEARTDMPETTSACAMSLLAP